MTSAGVEALSNWKVKVLPAARKSEVVDHSMLKPLGWSPIGPPLMSAVQPVGETALVGSSGRKSMSGIQAYQKVPMGVRPVLCSVMV